jgi:hypothetical protein
MARTPVATDDFNRASLGTTNWTQINSFNGSITIFGSVRVGGSSAQPPAGAMAAEWDADTFADDQYALIVIDALGHVSRNQNIGVILRASADTDGDRDYYYVAVGGDTFGTTEETTFGKIINGTDTQFAQSTTPTWSTTETIELEAEGTTLTVLKNGTALGGSFTTTDSDLTSGFAGIIGAGGDNVTGDDWEGGDITGAVAGQTIYHLPLIGVG